MHFRVTKRAANHLTQCLDSHPHTTDPHYLTVNHCQRSKSPDSSQTPTPQADLSTLGIKLHCSHNRGTARLGLTAHQWNLLFVFPFSTWIEMFLQLFTTYFSIHQKHRVWKLFSQTSHSIYKTLEAQLWIKIPFQQAPVTNRVVLYRSYFKRDHPPIVYLLGLWYTYLLKEMLY